MGHAIQVNWALVCAAFTLIAAGLAGFCAYVFVTLKRELRAAEAGFAQRLSTLEAEWKARNETLDERWSELSHISNLLVPPAPARSGLNITKRSQALQMSRRGEKPQDIAVTLGIPLAEVELLVKVQKIAIAAAQ